MVRYQKRKKIEEIKNFCQRIKKILLLRSQLIFLVSKRNQFSIIGLARLRVLPSFLTILIIFSFISSTVSAPILFLPQALASYDEERAKLEEELKKIEAEIAQYESIVAQASSRNKLYKIKLMN